MAPQKCKRPLLIFDIFDIASKAANPPEIRHFGRCGHVETGADSQHFQHSNLHSRCQKSIVADTFRIPTFTNKLSQSRSPSSTSVSPTLLAERWLWGLRADALSSRCPLRVERSS